MKPRPPLVRVFRIVRLRLSRHAGRRTVYMADVRHENDDAPGTDRWRTWHEKGELSTYDSPEQVVEAIKRVNARRLYRIDPA